MSRWGAEGNICASMGEESIYVHNPYTKRNRI